MGGSQSKDPYTTFTASIAPTDRAKCRACKQAIRMGSIRMSRDIPSTTGGNRGAVTHHYHMDHGMQAVTRVRCQKIPPAIEYDVSLSAQQRKGVEKAADKAVAAWHSRCQDAE